MNLKDPIWFREWVKILVREWMQRLTPRQFALVMFIFDRTAAWGKEWEFIKYETFATGVTSRDETVRYAGSACNSKWAAMAGMKELVRCGAVLRKRTGQGYWWSLNYEWKGENMRKLKRELVKTPTHELVKTPTPYKKYSKAIDKGILSRRGRERIGSDGDSSLSIETALLRAKAKTQEAVDRKAAKRKGKLNSMDIDRVWTAAMKSIPTGEFLDIATGRTYLTKRDAQALKSYSDRFIKSYPDKPFADYLTWVIHNWSGLRADLFAWMTKFPAPEAPVALFLIKHAEALEGAYLHERAFQQRRNLSPEDRKISKLVSEGMDPDRAKAKVLGRADTKSITNSGIFKPFSRFNQKRIDIALKSSQETNDYEN